MSAGRHTPAERAELALRDPRAMCTLLSEARTHRAAGSWEGSAFRSHPRGLVVDTIKFTNYWHVDQLCDIAITDGAGWDVQCICRDSRANGDPHPRPIEGGTLQVWRSGKWADAAYEEALRPRILSILSSVAEHVAAGEEALQARVQAERAQAQRQHEQMAAAAIAKATGEQSHG